MSTPKSLLIAAALATAASFGFAQTPAPVAAPTGAPAVTAAAPAKAKTAKKAGQKKHMAKSGKTKAAKAA